MRRPLQAVVWFGFLALALCAAAEEGGIGFEWRNEGRSFQMQAPGLEFGEMYFGSEIERDGKKLYRYRASDVRIYFEVSRDHRSVIVHRVLSKNSFQDFLFRANLPVGDDDALAQSKSFWALIEEGERARKV